MNASQLCDSICPPNSLYRQDFQQCICNYNYQMVNGVCKQCLPGLVYDTASSKCLAGFYSRTGDNSVLSVCRANEVPLNGICVCDSASIDLSGRCVPCPSAAFKSGNQCLSCSSFCQSCSSASACNNCQNGFALLGNQCQEVCGDGRRFVVQCDDGNTVNGDGCSSTCTVESGYTCYGGSAISTDICQKINPGQTSLALTVANGYPQYTSSAVVINLKLLPAKVRSDQELRSLFSYVFEPAIDRPKLVLLSANSYDPSDVRCVMEYQNKMPNDPVKVTITAADGSSRASVVVQIDTVANAKPSAFFSRRGVPDKLGD